MLAALNNVEQMLFARREITKFPANVPLDTQEMLGLHVIQVSLLNINLSSDRGDSKTTLTIFF